jgi:hypothetical protein
MFLYRPLPPLPEPQAMEQLLLPEDQLRDLFFSDLPLVRNHFQVSIPHGKGSMLTLLLPHKEQQLPEHHNQVHAPCNLCLVPNVSPL